MKRFYTEVAVCPADENASDGWQVTLDGRGIKTQVGAAQVVPTRALAEMLATEWREQSETIDPAGFVFRDMADYAIDVIGPDSNAAAANLLAFAQTDTLCYRADPEDALFVRQEELWEPLVTACERRHGVTFVRVSGIIHDPQKGPTLERLRAHLADFDEFKLAGMQTMTALAASLIIALEAAQEGADGEALFAASNAEEDWQAELWGWDADAQANRQLRLQAFTMAQEFLQAAKAS